MSVEPGSSLGVTGSHISKNQRPWKNVWGTRFLQVGNRYPEVKISSLWKKSMGNPVPPTQEPVPEFKNAIFTILKSWNPGSPTGEPVSTTFRPKISVLIALLP